MRVTSEEAKQKTNEVRERVKHFLEGYVEKERESDRIIADNPQLLSIVKKIIFEENGDEMLKPTSTQSSKIKNIAKSYRYIVENIMGLSVEEYDSIYSTALNESASLEKSIRLIYKYCPESIKESTLYDTKKMLLAICWPEYYNEHYKKPTSLDIFLGRGDCVGNLKRAGAIKDTGLFRTEEEEIELKRTKEKGEFGIKELRNALEYKVDEPLPETKDIKRKKNGDLYAEKDRKKSYNHGEGVDKIVYKAMKDCLPIFIMDTDTMFKALALPKENDFYKYGFAKIIEARGCYDSPLDFYFLNSPMEYQIEHFEEYLNAREYAKLPHSKILDTYVEIYNEIKEAAQKNASDYDDI